MKNSKKKSLLIEAIDMIESMKNCYFWSVSAPASNRRAYERTHRMNFCFSLKKHKYQVVLDTQCSCHNVYFSKEIYVDGVRKDLRALRKALKILT